MKSTRWKTTTGSLAIAFGGSLLAGSQVIDGELKVWFQLIGTIFATFGTGLMGYGVADRVTTTSQNTDMRINEAVCREEERMKSPPVRAHVVNQTSYTQAPPKSLYEAINKLHKPPNEMKVEEE